MGEKKEERKYEYEMPIPEEVKGKHILLIDPDISSLMNTSSMLEDASYIVTSTGIPDIALSMMRERVKQYDLIMAAVQMRGMDCFSFLKFAKTMSDVPIARMFRRTFSIPPALDKLGRAVMSYEEDLQLATKAIQQGACHYFVKPIGNNNIRSLWQFTVRKARGTPANENAGNHANAGRVVSFSEKPKDPKGKGKEIMVEAEPVLEHQNQRRGLTIVDGGGMEPMEIEKATKKRKGSNDGNKEKGKKKKKENCGRKSNKKVPKWNAELHAKFMRVLMMDSANATVGPGEQASGAPDVTNLPMAPNQDQNPKEQLSHPSDVNTALETRKGGASDGQEQVPIDISQRDGSSSSGKGIDPNHAGNVLQTPEASLGLQSQNIARVSPILMATSGGLNVGPLGGAGREYITCKSSFNSRPQLICSGGLNLGIQINQTGSTLRENYTREAPLLYNTKSRFGFLDTTNKSHKITPPGGTLMERIDQIRQAYRTSCRSGQASHGSQAHGINNPSENQNQANYAMSVEAIGSKMSCGKRKHSQYDYVNNGLAASSSALASGQTDPFCNNMVKSIGHIGSSASSMNYGFPPPPNVNQPNPTPSAVQFSCISPENYAMSFMQNASNLQTEPTGLVQGPNHPTNSPKGGLFGSTEMTSVNPTCHVAQFSSTSVSPREMPLLNANPNTVQFSSMSSEAPTLSFMQNAYNLQMEPTGFLQAFDFPLSGTNNNDLMGSNNLPKATYGTNQGLGTAGVPSEAGLANQPENLGGFVGINTSEGFLTSAQASNSEQTPIDDATLDEIFAELRPHFVDGDFKFSGSNINNSM